MLTVKKALRSTLGKKYLLAASGLCLVGFLVTHLAANLTLLLPDSQIYNDYVEALHSWGPLLTVAELGLAALFIFHAALAITVSVKNKGARSQNYAAYQSKKGPSKHNLSSLMKVSGLLLLAFLILHVWQFRFGPNIAEGYSVVVDGVEMRDMYRLVDETFTDPLWVGVYLLAMIVLGFHLRHGIWSAFQSLGVATERSSDSLYKIALVLAIIFAVGFLIIPIGMYLGVPNMIFGGSL